MLLIVNADDLGLREPINNEIFSLMEAGLVTSSTILANAPAFEHAAEISRRFPECSFGVHLNLTEFLPLSSSKELWPLLDENGCLSTKIFRTRPSRDLRSAIFQEWKLQVQRVLSAGVQLSHFDSHLHVHTLPRLFPVLKALQREFGIRKVRPTINLDQAGQRVLGLPLIKKRLFTAALKSVYRTRTPDGLSHFRVFHAALLAGRAPHFRHLELMVHPGASNGVYQNEVALLRSDWRRLLRSDTTMGSYHSL
jgi:predicted glycoside hydrolase/deacetylase ChbG (UPF0249 family)